MSMLEQAIVDAKDLVRLQKQTPKQRFLRNIHHKSKKLSTAF